MDCLCIENISGGGGYDACLQRFYYALNFSKVEGVYCLGWSLAASVRYKFKIGQKNIELFLRPFFLKQMQQGVFLF